MTMVIASETCVSAWGLDADRHAKSLICLMPKGSMCRAYLRSDLIRNPLDQNPRTGAHVSVAQKSVPFFKTGKEMRERLNKNASA